MAFCATRYPNIAGTLEIRGGTRNENGGRISCTSLVSFPDPEKTSEVMKAGGLDVQEPSE